MWCPTRVQFGCLNGVVTISKSRQGMQRRGWAQSNCLFLSYHSTTFIEFKSRAQAESFRINVLKACIAQPYGQQKTCSCMRPKDKAQNDDECLTCVANSRFMFALCLSEPAQLVTDVASHSQKMENIVEDVVQASKTQVCCSARQDTFSSIAGKAVVEQDRAWRLI